MSLDSIGFTSNNLESQGINIASIFKIDVAIEGTYKFRNELTCRGNGGNQSEI